MTEHDIAWVLIIGLGIAIPIAFLLITSLFPSHPSGH
jgi:hypothetical protein